MCSLFLRCNLPFQIQPPHEQICQTCCQSRTSRCWQRCAFFVVVVKAATTFLIQPQNEQIPDLLPSQGQARIPCRLYLLHKSILSVHLPSKQIGQTSRHTDSHSSNHVWRNSLQVFPQKGQTQAGHLLLYAQEGGPPEQLLEVAVSVGARLGWEEAGVQPQEGQAVEKDGECDVCCCEVGTKQPPLTRFICRR